MRGSEAIQALGSSLYPGFSIAEEPRRSVYKRVYEKFIAGLAPDNREKGLLLVGGIGVGKTALMRIFHRLFKDSARKFKWVTATELRDLLDEYTVSEIKAMYGYDWKLDLYIDDIGFGNPNSNRYGNTVNLISEIICERYDLFVQTGIKTHLSSNLPAQVDKAKYPDVVTLTDLYGNRIVDRMREMCETLIFKGESLRK
jgi:DNA replication protein DnaC